MTPLLVHSLIMYAIPPLCGLGAGLLANSLRLRWYLQGLAAMLAVMLCLVMQYGGLLVMVGFLHGNWPGTATLAQWTYGLLWFAIPAIFLSVPGVIAGYVGGTVWMLSRRQAGA